MLATQCNNVHGISREKDLIISFNMFKIFPWKWINIIYLEDNSILEKLDKYISRSCVKVVPEVLVERCLLPRDTYAAEKRKEMR